MRGCPRWRGVAPLCFTSICAHRPLPLSSKTQISASQVQPSRSFVASKRSRAMFFWLFRGRIVRIAYFWMKCSILYSLLSMLCALSSMLYALCSILYSPCSILYSLFSILCSLFSILCSLCSILYALYSIRYSLYSILYFSLNMLLAYKGSDIYMKETGGWRSVLRSIARPSPIVFYQHLRSSTFTTLV